jgi:RNA polymerase sigma-70 factor (ECF subfamily)
MENQSDQQLILAYLKGNQDSLEILISRYLQPIYGFICQFTKNSADAQDITQEVFIKVWRNLKKFDCKKSFKSWLYTIAKNTAIDFLRRKKNLTFTDLNEDSSCFNYEETISDPAPLPPEILDRQNLVGELESVLQEIPFNYQLVVIMHYKNELTFSEISEILNKPLNTVKSQHLRAISYLRRFFVEK